MAKAKQLLSAEAVARINQLPPLPISEGEAARRGLDLYESLIADGRNEVNKQKS